MARRDPLPSSELEPWPERLRASWRSLARLAGRVGVRRRVSWGHAPGRPWAELDLEDRVRYVLVVLGLLAVLALVAFAGGGPAA